jgi:riboflavin kinase / FMN adenylyltransferase
VKLLRHARELDPPAGRVCAAIGVFDGVHLGHREVIRRTVEQAHRHQAPPVAITFDRHPNTVVAPEHTPPLIYSLDQKLRALAALEIEATLLLRFDRAFSEQTGEAFIRKLAEGFGGLQSLCVGSEFTFGRRRSGNVALLQTLGRELGFDLHALGPVTLGGEPISSTRIRDAIRRSDLQAASQMLGRAYSLAGRVIAGDGVGRQLGFPTANLEVGGLVLPPNGVYAVQALLQGQPHPAVLNIGWRPTLAVAAPGLQVEAHLLDFAGDLYDAELEIVFVEKLRDEAKFGSREALREQIRRDIAAARARV